MWAIFDNYDNKDEGGITKESLREAFKRISIEKSDSEIDAVFKEHDLNNDGKI